MCIRDRVKVTDFGIARVASSNTISTNAMGSVHYSSPEQEMCIRDRGLAAPQVGILKQIVVIDTTGEDPIVLINPEIINLRLSDRRRRMLERSGNVRSGNTPELRLSLIHISILCRDKIGVKPLYYTLFKNKIFFGSTIQDLSLIHIWSPLSVRQRSWQQRLFMRPTLF